MEPRAPWRAACRLMVAALLPLAQGHAQRPGTASTLAQADSAWGADDRARARVLYGEALARDSTQSRAVFRLAQLETDPVRALVLFRRYVALEPDDPWGHMAEGDQLGRMGRVEEGLGAYATAHSLAPDERDVALGRAKLLERAGRAREAAAQLSAWTMRHPNDGESWDVLGRLRLRSSRPKAAIEALEEAAERRVPGSDKRLAAARAMAAPSITPEVTTFGDSDGNRTTRLGGSLDFMPLDGVRLGARVHQQDITSDVETAPEGPQQPPGPPPAPRSPPSRSPRDVVRGTDLGLHLSAVPAPAVRLSVDAGATRYDASANATPWTASRVKARVRARTSPAGPSLDLRAERGPVGFSSLLIANRVLRSEGRVTLDIPLSVLRLRGTGWLGQFEAMSEPANSRAGAEVAVVGSLGSGRVQPSVNYRLGGYQRPSTAGYFAPQRAETVEGGLYVEGSEDETWSLAADLGGGKQRVTEHGGAPGPWSTVWRAWASAAFAIGPSRSWFLEVEAYDAPFSLESAVTAGSWRFLSVSSGIRWALR